MGGFRATWVLKDTWRSKPWLTGCVLKGPQAHASCMKVSGWCRASCHVWNPECWGSVSLSLGEVVEMYVSNWYGASQYPNTSHCNVLHGLHKLHYGFLLLICQCGNCKCSCIFLHLRGSEIHTQFRSILACLFLYFFGFDPPP